jgi:hypothetical protein
VVTLVSDFDHATMTSIVVEQNLKCCGRDVASWRLYGVAVTLSFAPSGLAHLSNFFPRLALCWILPPLRGSHRSSGATTLHSRNVPTTQTPS